MEKITNEEKKKLNNMVISDVIDALYKWIEEDNFEKIMNIYNKKQRNKD